MKTMTSRKETDPPESNHAQRYALRHQCPVCNTVHEVSAARAQFAYGRQLACSPDCEAERRRRNRASYRLASTPFAGPAFARPSSATLTAAVANRIDADPRSHGKLYLVGSREQKAVIAVTVESTDVLCVRRAVFQSGGGSVGILKATPVPRSSRIRLAIGTKADAVELIMAAIMRSVTRCEFGRVARI